MANTIECFTEQVGKRVIGVFQPTDLDLVTLIFSDHSSLVFNTINGQYWLESPQTVRSKVIQRWRDVRKQAEALENLAELVSEMDLIAEPESLKPLAKKLLDSPETQEMFKAGTEEQPNAATPVKQDINVLAQATRLVENILFSDTMFSRPERDRLSDRITAALSLRGLLVVDRTDGVELIAKERAKQVSVEGYTPEHDLSEHGGGELIKAARAYLLAPLKLIGSRPPAIWPWSSEQWKPTPDDRVRELVKAGALIAAEIDRILASQK